MAFVALAVVAASAWPANGRSTFATPSESGPVLVTSFVATSAPSAPDEQSSSDPDPDPDDEERDEREQERDEQERDELDETERAMPLCRHGAFGPRFQRGSPRLSSAAARRLRTLGPTTGHEREEDRPPES